MRILKITPPQLRTKEQEAKRTATWLELFYDLAFVVAVAVLAERLLQDISGVMVAIFFGYFALLWWLWASHTFYADRYDTDDLVYRLLAAAQMIAIVVIASSLTGQTASTMAFAWGYAGARWLLVFMYSRVHRHVEETRVLAKGYLTGFGLAAVVWTASAIAPEDARFVLWSVALVIDLATPWVMRREQARVPLDVSHLPERFGLFTILVLGESIAAVVAGVAHARWSISHVIAAAAGIGVATGVWWMYFDNATGKVVRRSAEIRRTWRPTAWIYTHLPLAAALAALGVGLEVAVTDAGNGPMAGSHRWLLVGSAAVALGSMALIQYASSADPGGVARREITFNRLAGIPFLLLIGLLGSAESQWIAIGVFGVCVAEVVADLSAWAHDEPEALPQPGLFEEE